MGTSNKDDVFTHGLYGEDIGFLLNSPNCDPVDPEDEEEVNQIIKQEIEDEDLEYKCRCCKYVADTFELLEKHENGHRARGTFLECEYCEFCTNVREVMIQHVTKHTGERPFKCQKCEFSSRWKRDLIKHQVKHSDVKNFMCTKCDFTTKWYNNIRHHMVSHSTDRPFTCHICDMKFKRKGGLDYHLYRHNDYKPKKCLKCDFRCKTNFELKYHQHKHSDVRNFPCTFPGCVQRCKTKSDLVKHLKIHTNIRDKVCDICDKGFVTLANLSKHKLRHVTERKFQCDLCTRKFKTITSLRHHLQTHTDHKPFVCDVCGHQCRNRHNLNTHKLVHSADRKYKCPICPYAGKFPFHIFAHIGTFHGDEYAYFCEICRKPFRRYSQLQTHCGRMHKGINLLSAPPEIKQEVPSDEKSPTPQSATEYSPTSPAATEKSPTSQATNEEFGIDTQVGLEATSTDKNNTDDSPLQRKSVDEPKTDIEAAPIEKEQHIHSDLLHQQKEEPSSGNIDSIPDKIKPKIEDPHVIIYNVGPFRLPLASKGFNFNFEKTGKKPKQWFMEPQNMTDELAADKQRAYMEKKARNMERSRGATIRKFGWRKPPFKPSLEENPRYKRDKEIRRKGRESGRIFVKQAPELQDLINIGRANIRKIKICKRADLLMKNWKEVEVKLEKLDGYDIPNSYRPRSSKQPLSHETMSITDASESFNPPTLDNVSQESRSPTKRQLYIKEPRRSPTKKLKLSIKGVRKNRARKPKLVLEQEIELSAHPEQDSDTVANSEGVSKGCTPKAKRSVGRPRKYPPKLIALKSTKIKSANDLIISPLLSLSNNYINEVDHKSPADPVSEEEYDHEANNIHPLVTATESSVIHSFNNKSSGIISINAHVNTPQSLDTEQVPFTDSKTVSSNSVPPEVTMDHHSIASSISEDFNTEDMSTSSSVTAAANPDIRKQIQSQKSTGRLNLAISKLIAKTCISLNKPCTKVTCTQLPVSVNSSIQALADCKRHRKSEMPRKVKKVCNSVDEQYYSDEDDLPLSTLTKTSQKEPLPILINNIKIEPEDTTTIDRETTSMKDTIGRQRKHHKATGTMKKKRKCTLQATQNGECTEKDTCKRMFDNLKDPIKRTQNLTDLDILRKGIELQDVADMENEHSQNQHQQQNVTAKICKPQYASNLPLISIYQKISLKELLSKPPEYDRDWTMLTTDLVGPEPDKSIMQLDIHDAQNKDDLIKIQKNLRTEKYRLKKLAPESCTIKHINKLINTVKHATYKISSQPGQQSHISDYPILKKVLMRGKESDNDVIITDDQDLYQKRAPIKLCLKKNVIFKQNDVKKTHKKFSDHLKKTAVDQLQTVKSVKKKTVPTTNKVSDKALIASMSAIQPVVIVENICPAIAMKDSLNSRIGKKQGDSGEAAKASAIVLATSDIQNIQTKRKYTKKSVLASERTACNSSPVARNKMASKVTENIPDIKRKYVKKSNDNDDIIGNISAATTKKVNKIKRKYIKKSVFWNNTRKFIDQPLTKKTDNSVSKISDHHEEIKRKYTKNSLFWSQKNGEEISLSKPATISTNKIDATISNQTDRKKRKYTKTSVFWSQKVNNGNKSATGHASTISHVENIKRKYSKKSGCWVEKAKVPKAKNIQPTSCFKVKSINKRKATKRKVKNTGTLPTGEKEFLVSVAVNGDDQPTSSDIRRVLQNYIANRRKLSSKKKASKHKDLKMCMKKAKRNGSGLKVKKSSGIQKNKKSKNIKSTNKKNILKVKIPRKQKPNSNIEIYVDVEESETIGAEAVSNNSNSSTDQHYVDSTDVNCTVVLQPVLVLADDKFEMLLNTSIVKSETEKEIEVVIKREPSDTEITDQARAIKYEQHVEDCKTTVHKIKEETDLLLVDSDNNNDLHIMKFESQ